ncbi:hypothetical protein [Clostridium botulinum]
MNIEELIEEFKKALRKTIFNRKEESNSILSKNAKYLRIFRIFIMPYFHLGSGMTTLFSIIFSCLL